MISSINFVAGATLHRLVDDGLANILGLETLTHGTNPINYLGIRVFGGDPAHGGKQTGSTKDWVLDDTTHYFYTFKDSEFEIRNQENLNIFLKVLAIPHVFRSVGPRIHIFLSSYNLSSKLLPSSDIPALKITKLFFGTLTGVSGLLVTPLLRFRFNRLDPERLKDDSSYYGAAYKTGQLIEPWRIGLLGALITGFNTGWFQRAKASPMKIVTGIAQLTAAAAFAVFALNTIATSSPVVTFAAAPFLAGMILA